MLTVRTISTVESILVGGPFYVAHLEDIKKP